MTINSPFGERVAPPQVAPAPPPLPVKANPWRVVVVGVGLLAAGPAIARLCIALERPGLGPLSFCAISFASVPAIILAICATLNWRPARQRFLLFGAALAIQPASYFVFMCSHPPTSRDLSLFW